MEQKKKTEETWQSSKAFKFERSFELDINVVLPARFSNIFNTYLRDPRPTPPLLHTKKFTYIVACLGETSDRHLHLSMTSSILLDSKR
jgi:hypothetical protein